MKINDTHRLNHLEKLHAESAPQDWVAVLYDGMLILDEPSAIEDKYDVVTKPRPTIRQAIDAAIRASKPKKARGGR